MKKIVRLFLLLPLVSFLCFNTLTAQSLEMVSKEDSVNGQINTDVKTHAYVKNISSEAKQVKVKMEVISLAENHEVSFCWDVCYAPTTTDLVSMGQRTLNPGQTTTSTDFYGIMNVAAEGTTVVKYIFYVKDNESDKVEYTATYQIGGTSVEEETTGITSINPNPAGDYAQITRASAMTGKAEIKVYTNTGVLVNTIDANGGDTYMLNTANMAQGSYFYTLSENGIIRETKGFIVIH